MLFDHISTYKKDENVFSNILAPFSVIQSTDISSLFSRAEIGLPSLMKVNLELRAYLLFKYWWEH